MTTETEQAKPAGSSSPWKTAFIVLIVIQVLLGAGYWVVTTALFPTHFNPVTLDQKEEQVLEQKLERLDNTMRQTARGRRSAPDNQAPLTPEPYSEKGASREIDLTEKELNALLAKNTDLAQRLAIDLSDNLASAKLLIPLDPDFPIFGGKTLKVTAGLEMRFANGRPVIILKGVSIWGVPLPNAWLGNMKNIDLVQEFGNDKGFWKAFADGVDEIDVKEGKLWIKLKE